jgi:hypothetical protein
VALEADAFSIAPQCLLMVQDLAAAITAPLPLKM